VKKYKRLVRLTIFISNIVLGIILISWGVPGQVVSIIFLAYTIIGFLIDYWARKSVTIAMNEELAKVKKELAYAKVIK